MLEALLIIDPALWTPPQAVQKAMLGSALLPLLENVFGNNSLLEICKEAQLMQVYLRFVKTLAKHEALVPCLLSLDQRFVPVQSKSVFQLLEQLCNTAKIFITCLDKVELVADANNKKPEQ